MDTPSVLFPTAHLRHATLVQWLDEIKKQHAALYERTGAIGNQLQITPPTWMYWQGLSREPLEGIDSNTIGQIRIVVDRKLKSGWARLSATSDP